MYKLVMTPDRMPGGDRDLEDKSSQIAPPAIKGRERFSVKWALVGSVVLVGALIGITEIVALTFPNSAALFRVENYSGFNLLNVAVLGTGLGFLGPYLSRGKSST